MPFFREPEFDVSGVGRIYECDMMGRVIARSFSLSKGTTTTNNLIKEQNISIHCDRTLHAEKGSK